MAFIHHPSECLTGVQERSPWTSKTDLRADFVMVYGVDREMPERVRVWREKGYTVHLMTGSAWGEYQDYLNGDWDGVSHWEEAQRDRSGAPILHGPDTPYLCPTEAFGRYLAEKLKPAVDAGVEAVHLEEPEFWDAGGYGAAFRAAWEEYYGEKWRPPHENCENRYRASALKVYLFRRLIGKVSAGVKAYAKSRGRDLAFYVPTHSLVNYTQWKILSPEGTLLDVPTVDGCIAQVWTGTSRAGNVYHGHYGERVFETAFLEYGIMQELVRGTGRRMWFLHDPVEDNPQYTWESFRDNYLKTVTASLMHPGVARYEVCPWPHRVFHGVYPKRSLRDSESLTDGEALEDAKSIPPAYAELISALIQTLGDMEQPESGFIPEGPRIGLLMADSGLYQRSFPDSVPHGEGGEEAMNRRLFSLLDRQHAGIRTDAESEAIMKDIAADPRLYNDYAASGAFPHFFGLAMPLVKAGIPLRPVQMENLPRCPEEFGAFSALILSYEWMKPREPAEHAALADWVRRGGVLLTAGDGSDPYHAARGWWNTDGRSYDHPMQHLWETLGLGREPEEGTYACGSGRVGVKRISPARITMSRDAGEAWLRWVLREAAPAFEPRNYFLMRRGPYRIAAVMEEACTAEPLVLEGCFADLGDVDFRIVRRKELHPGETALLFDLEDLREPVRPVASTARIECLEETEQGFRLVCSAAEGIRIRMRLRLNRPAVHAEARGDGGAYMTSEVCRWDEDTKTLLVGFKACHQRLEVILFAEE